MHYKFPFQKKKDYSGAIFAGGALLGGLIGSVAAVFLTPVSGKKARRAVTDKTRTGVDWLTKEVGERKDQLSESASKLLQKADEKITSTKKKVDDDRKATKTSSIKSATKSISEDK